MEGEGSIVKGEGQLHKQLEEIQINSKGPLLQMLKVVFPPSFDYWINQTH